jgi:hypothetical protein
MKIVEITRDAAQIQLNLDELTLFQSCINEALELGEEFSTRVGFERDYAKTVFQELELIAAKIKNSETQT